MADDEDQKSSESNLVGRGGTVEGVARRRGGICGRPEELDGSPTGLYEDFGVSVVFFFKATRRALRLLQGLSRAFCSQIMS